MENTKSSKEKFFAQYWGQNIQYQKGKERSYLKVNEHNIDDIYSDFLALKPLSSISDEEAIEVTRILLTKQGIIYDFTKTGDVDRREFDYTHGCDAEELISIPYKGTPKGLYQNGGWKESDFHVRIIIRDAYQELPYFSSLIRKVGSTGTWSYNHLTSYSQLEAFDYLRSKGYALPYMGLSVEQQIEYGWIKLKA